MGGFAGDIVDLVGEAVTEHSQLGVAGEFVGQQLQRIVGEIGDIVGYQFDEGRVSVSAGGNSELFYGRGGLTMGYEVAKWHSGGNGVHWQ